MSRKKLKNRRRKDRAQRKILIAAVCIAAVIIGVGIGGHVIKKNAGKTMTTAETESKKAVSKKKATAKFQEMRLDFDEVTSLGTPRRTALLVKNLAETQQGASSEYKGPSTAIAFDKDGNPTKAAIGFARGKKSRCC